MNKARRFLRMFGFFAAVLCFVLISRSLSSATNIQQELTVSLNLTCTPPYSFQCDNQSFLSTGFGGPAKGSANFEPVAQAGASISQQRTRFYGSRKCLVLVFLVVRPTGPFLRRTYTALEVPSS